MAALDRVEERLDVAVVAGVGPQDVVLDGLRDDRAERRFRSHAFSIVLVASFTRLRFQRSVCRS